MNGMKVNQVASDETLPGKQRNKADIPELPEHLKDLYERAIKDVTDNSIKVKLAKLLTNYSEAFASSKDDLGTCSLIKHKIDTTGAAPIRQPLRRTPIGFEKEELQYLKDQLSSGVIQPSKSAWASPVVLVRKKDN